MTNQEELKEQITNIYYEIALKKAHGEYANGLWHYLRAYPDDQSPTGWEFIEGEEVSPLYPVNEYYGEPGHPFTYVIADRENEWDGPLRSGCIWEDSPNWDECEWAHPADDYEHYVYIGLNYWSACDDAIIYHLIPSQTLPDNEEECRAILIANKFVPFKLGAIIEDYYDEWITEKVTQTLDDLTQAYNKNTD